MTEMKYWKASFLFCSQGVHYLLLNIKKCCPKYPLDRAPLDFLWWFPSFLWHRGPPMLSLSFTQWERRPTNAFSCQRPQTQSRLLFLLPEKYSKHCDTMSSLPASSFTPMRNVPTRFDVWCWLSEKFQFRQKHLKILKEDTAQQHLTQVLPDLGSVGGFGGNSGGSGCGEVVMEKMQRLLVTLTTMTMTVVLLDGAESIGNK